MANNVKRYSLVTLDKDTQIERSYGVKLVKDNYGKNSYMLMDGKSTLSDIDLYTSTCDSKADLCCDLQVSPNSDIHIGYNNNGPQTAVVLYKKAIKILPFAKERKTTVDTNTSHFTELFNGLLKASNNERFIEFIHSEGLLNDYLYQKLIDYRNHNLAPYTSSAILRDKIATELSHYKVLRDIYVGTELYKKKFTKKPSIFDEEDEVIDTSREEKVPFDEVEKNQIDIYLSEGEEGIYALYDEILPRVKQKIREFHKEGL